MASARRGKQIGAHDPADHLASVLPALEAQLVNADSARALAHGAQKVDALRALMQVHPILRDYILWRTLPSLVMRLPLRDPNEPLDATARLAEGAVRAVARGAAAFANARGTPAGPRTIELRSIHPTKSLLGEQDQGPEPAVVAADVLEGPAVITALLQQVPAGFPSALRLVSLHVEGLQAALSSGQRFHRLTSLELADMEANSQVVVPPMATLQHLRINTLVAQEVLITSLPSLQSLALENVFASEVHVAGTSQLAKVTADVGSFEYVEQRLFLQFADAQASAGLRDVTLYNAAVVGLRASTPIEDLCLQFSEVPELNLFGPSLLRLTCRSASQARLDLGLCPSLTRLELEDCNDCTQLQGLEALKSLKELTITFSRLAALPALPACLTQLHVSDMSLTALPVLPEALTRLSIGRLHSTVLPPLPASLTSLGIIDSELTELPALPDTLAHLDIGSSKLTVLPPLPATLTHLRLTRAALAWLPSLPAALQCLEAWSNKLTRLPPLPAALTRLDISYNELTALPALPAALQDLDATGNRLTALPTLPAALTWLRLGGNDLQGLLA